ncbi:MAG: anthranilate synthase component I [Rhizobiales bacterium]|nr:anthranilate synthase component I [Hyphomicrobiales bacterium]NRB14850.1 anthranilate synthase component I [Hyphomicrobiales bacterium]
MKITPNLDQFTSLYNQEKSQIVYTRHIADLETPISALQKLTAGKTNCILLESVNDGTSKGRYSMVGMEPDIIWRANGDKSEINLNAHKNSKQFVPQAGDTLSNLRALLDMSRIDMPEDIPPMMGVYGYMGFDTVKLVENIDADLPDPLDLPDMYMIRPTIIAIFDNVKEEIILVTSVWPDKATSAKTAHAKAVERLTTAIDLLNGPRPKSDIGEQQYTYVEPVSNLTADEYKDMVRKAKQYILSGDIFQVVLSQRFTTDFTLSPFALYRALRRINPSPFLYYLDFDGLSVVGSSPEILVRVRDNEVSIRPIAGTRPRGKTLAETKKYSEELLADPKELAEHLMLLDLGRNDVGHVAKLGSVEITDSFFLEYYSEVMHIVSNVTGQLDEKYDAIDALLAGFPAGTVSGAPKVRAMEIIEELENIKRGPYAGCVGYFGADGNMDTCIVLRTAIIKDGKMHVQAGAGIVADSDPESEQQECVNKAKALFRSAEEAIKLANASKYGQ